MTSYLELTYPGVLLAVFAEQLCLPIPSVIFLMAAGALSARGEMRTSIIILMGVSGCLVADGLWFWFGRRWGSQTLRLVCRFSADPRACSQNAREQFRRYGLALLCVAKFFPGLDLVMPPLAGAEGVSLAVFLAFDTLGGSSGQASTWDWAMSSPRKWMLQFGWSNILGRPSVSGLEFRSAFLPAGGDWLWCE